jgi:hypothetical protein
MRARVGALRGAGLAARRARSAVAVGDRGAVSVPDIDEARSVRERGDIEDMVRIALSFLRAGGEPTVESAFDAGLESRARGPT